MNKCFFFRIFCIWLIQSYIVLYLYICNLIQLLGGKRVIRNTSTIWHYKKLLFLLWEKQRSFLLEPLIWSFRGFFFLIFYLVSSFFSIYIYLFQKNLHNVLFDYTNYIMTYLSPWSFQKNIVWNEGFPWNFFDIS